MALSPLKVSVAVGKINLGGSSKPKNEGFNYDFITDWKRIKINHKGQYRAIPERTSTALLQHRRSNQLIRRKPDLWRQTQLI
jgi:hypothetical protein